MYLSLEKHSVVLPQMQHSLVTGRLKDAIRELIPGLAAKGSVLTAARSDDTGSRTLTCATYTNTNDMTVESCIGFCSSQSTAFVYTGVEYGQECCA